MPQLPTQYFLFTASLCLITESVQSASVSHKIKTTGKASDINHLAMFLFLQCLTMSQAHILKGPLQKPNVGLHRHYYFTAATVI